MPPTPTERLNKIVEGTFCEKGNPKFEELLTFIEEECKRREKSSHERLIERVCKIIGEKRLTRDVFYGKIHPQGLLTDLLSKIEGEK